MTIPDCIPLINPRDRSFTERLWLMWAGLGTPGYVWADSAESAFEHWVEYLDDHAPGCLVSHEEFEAVCDRVAQAHGVASWTSLVGSESISAGRLQCLQEECERDLTPVGHTVLKHGQYIPSWEWGGSEVPADSQEYRNVHARSIRTILAGDLEAIAEELSDDPTPGPVYLAVNREGGWSVHPNARLPRGGWVAEVVVEPVGSEWGLTGPESGTPDWHGYAGFLINAIVGQVEDGK
jgi:hypothetical protein